MPLLPRDSSTTLDGPASPRPSALTLLTWTNVLMGLSAASATFATCQVLGEEADFIAAAFAFAIITATYTRDRLTGPDSEGAPGSREAWMARHHQAMRTWMGLCVLLALVTAVLRPWCALALVLAWISARLYAKPWISARGRRVALRQLPGMKVPYVVAVWVTVAILPVAAGNNLLTLASTWWWALSVLLIGSVEVINNDLRDVGADRLDGTRSLPVLLGVARAKRLGYAFAVLGLLVSTAVAPLVGLVWGGYAAALLACHSPERDARLRPWIESQVAVAALAAAVPAGAFGL
nr:UbiA family prenyltransferase [Streptomyces sp. NBC_01175]